MYIDDEGIHDATNFVVYLIQYYFYRITYLAIFVSLFARFLNDAASHLEKQKEYLEALRFVQNMRPPISPPFRKGKLFLFLC